MLPYYIDKAGNSDWLGNIEICVMKPDKKIFINNWLKIKATIDNLKFRDSVLMVDNMYSSTEKDITNNEELKLLLQIISEITETYNLSLLLGCHNKKGTEALKDLISDQIQGGKTLVNVVTNCLMIHSSALSPNLRIAKIVKGGRTGKNELYKIPFKLRWSDETSTFKKEEVIMNLAAHFSTPKKKWQYKLLWEVYDNEEMQVSPTFTREKFREYVPDEFSDYSSTDKAKANNLTRFLNDMKAWGFLGNNGRDKWRFIKSAMKELEHMKVDAK
jgi:hypothetical protein